MPEEEKGGRVFSIMFVMLRTGFTWSFSIVKLATVEWDFRYLIEYAPCCAEISESLVV
jgi:hypothetical protein